MRLFNGLAAVAQARLRRRYAGLLPKLAAVLAGLLGIGLLAASAVSGLAVLVGPILALALVGIAFLLAAAALWAVGPARRLQPPPSEPAQNAKDGITDSEAAFAVGFTLGRLLLRKLAG